MHWDRWRTWERWPALGRTWPRGRARDLRCEMDAGLFLVGGGPWLAALLLRFELAARRAAISDPARPPCRRRLLGEALQMQAEMQEAHVALTVAGAVPLWRSRYMCRRDFFKFSGRDVMPRARRARG